MIPSDYIELELKEDHSSQGEQTKTVISVSSAKVGEGKVFYLHDETSYDVKVQSSLPYFGLYSSNEANENTYVWGLYNYDADQAF